MRVCVCVDGWAAWSLAMACYSVFFFSEQRAREKKNVVSRLCIFFFVFAGKEERAEADMRWKRKQGKGLNSSTLLERWGGGTLMRNELNGHRLVRTHICLSTKKVGVE